MYTEIQFLKINASTTITTCTKLSTFGFVGDCTEENKKIQMN